MKITVDQVMELRPCKDWPRGRVERIVGDGLDLDQTKRALLKLNPYDCRWVVSRLLPAPLRVEWSCLCAERVLYLTESARPQAEAAIVAAREVVSDCTFETRRIARTTSEAVYGAAHRYVAGVALFACYAAYNAVLAACDVYGAIHPPTTRTVGAAYYAAIAAADEKAEHVWQIRTAVRLINRLAVNLEAAPEANPFVLTDSEGF